LFIPPTTGAEGIIYAGRRSGCPLTPIASEAVSLYSVKLTASIHHVNGHCIALKVFKVRGQRSRSEWD